MARRLNVPAALIGFVVFVFTVAGWQWLAHAPPSAPTTPPAMGISLLLLAGGVWAAYGFVVYQVARIYRQ